MSRYFVSRHARKDVDDIWLHVATESGSTEAADRVVDRISHVFPRLAAFPGMGPSRDEFSPGLRSFPVDAYLIFYKKVRSGVRIVRVVHGARNLRRVFRRRK